MAKPAQQGNAKDGAGRCRPRIACVECLAPGGKACRTARLAGLNAGQSRKQPDACRRRRGSGVAADLRGPHQPNPARSRIALARHQQGACGIGGGKAIFGRRRGLGDQGRTRTRERGVAAALAPVIPQSLQGREARRADRCRVGRFEQGRPPARATVAACEGRRIGRLGSGEFDRPVEIGKLARRKRAESFGSLGCGQAKFGRAPIPARKGCKHVGVAALHAVRRRGNLGRAQHRKDKRIGIAQRIDAHAAPVAADRQQQCHEGGVLGCPLVAQHCQAELGAIAIAGQRLAEHQRFLHGHIAPAPQRLAHQRTGALVGLRQKRSIDQQARKGGIGHAVGNAPDQLRRRFDVAKRAQAQCAQARKIRLGIGAWLGKCSRDKRAGGG